MDEQPGHSLGMISYLGFPIALPDKTPFGTLCVLDTKGIGTTARLRR